LKPEKLFKEALGLRSPWRVEEVLFSPEQRCLDITIDFPRGGSFRCPECDAPNAKAYDTQEEEWRHHKNLGALCDLGEIPFFESTLARRDCCLGSPTLD